MWNAFLVPSGRHRGSRKHERPFAVCASTRNASHIGAEQNHLAPVTAHAPSAGSAVVVFARTSEPPCRSVMAIPDSAPDFSVAGTMRGS